MSRRDSTVGMLLVGVCGHKATQAADWRSAVLQALIVQFGGEAFSTHPLSWQQWGACLGIGALSLIVRELLLLIRVPDKAAAADSSDQ